MNMLIAPSSASRRWQQGLSGTLCVNPCLPVFEGTGRVFILHAVLANNPCPSASEGGSPTQRVRRTYTHVQETHACLCVLGCSNFGSVHRYRVRPCVGSQGCRANYPVTHTGHSGTGEAHLAFQYLSLPYASLKMVDAMLRALS